jgi:hypothetical protein
MLRMKNPAYFGFAVFLILLSAVLSPNVIQAQTSKAKVSIVCNGQTMTTQPMTIMTGQAVNLSYTATGGTVIYPTWQVSFTSVTAYTATTQSATETPINISNLKQESVKMHWIDQGTKSVTLLYYLSGGGQGSVTATFNLVGPTNVKVTAVTSGTITTDTGAKLNVTGKVTCFDNGTQVGLADGKTSAGIAFTAAATMPSGSSGTFGWVQIINSDNYQYSGPNGYTAAEKSTGGLDLEAGKTTYVYGIGNWVDDSPSMPLGSGTAGITQASRQFEATMYLMWLADSAADTIPVPIGMSTWYTGWTVTYNPNSTDPTCKWTITRPYVTPYPFNLSYTRYPLWTSVSTIQKVQ